MKPKDVTVTAKDIMPRGAEQRSNLHESECAKQKRESSVTSTSKDDDQINTQKKGWRNPEGEPDWIAGNSTCFPSP